jgi:hypothetical protein
MKTLVATLALFTVVSGASMLFAEEATTATKPALAKCCTSDPQGKCCTPDANGKTGKCCAAHEDKKETTK